jgi:hypothetical protein
MLSIHSTFSEIFEILATGKPEEFKDAKKIIDKKWSHDHESFDKEWPLIEKYIQEFESISSPLNKSAVISGMSFFYLVFGDNHFETLKDFAVKNLVSSNGHVREAMRHTADWLYSSLTSRVEPFVYPEGKELTSQQVEDQKIATGQYFDLVREIESLIEKYDDGKDTDVEYIDNMKPSIHKSLQIFWSRFTGNRVYRHLLEKSTPISFEMLMKRKEIETEITNLLKQAQSDFDIEDVKEVVYEEDGTDGMREIIAMFDTGKRGAPEIGEVIEVVTDIWNYFPHRSLGGVSPAEYH